MDNAELNHHILARRSRPTPFMKRDVDYVVQNGEVIIVDEFTGRLMLGRRYSDGPASGHRGQGARKGGAREQDAGHHHLPELLPHVSKSSAGMTGTAKTEEEEFQGIYDLDVVADPHQ